MNSTVAVAPREILDYVYRATRLTGADHGVANEIARAASFAQVQLGSQLANVLAALEDGETPVLGLPLVAAAERELDTAVELPGGVVVADLALFAWEACRRGHEIEMTCGDGDTRTPEQWLATGGAMLGIAKLCARASVEAAEGQAARVAQRSTRAAASGSALDRDGWQRLVSAAAAYLVAEHEIDSTA